MKKLLIAFVLVVSHVFVLSSCGGNGGSSSCNHEYGDWETQKGPTCKEEGIVVRYCEKCNAREKSYIPTINNHVVTVDEAKAPTCIETGLTQGTHCSVCGEIFVAQQPVEKVSHTPSDWIIESNATADSNGVKYKECTVCSIRLEEEDIPFYGLSADQQVVKKMNNVLAIEEYPDNIEDVIDALAEQGFNAESFVPHYEGYSFVWSKTEHIILVIKNEEVTSDHINLADYNR